MHLWFRMFTLAALTVSLVACGKSDQEKAKDKADGIVAEYNALATELNGKRPSSSWTDEDLNDYEAKLNRLEALDAEAEALSGTDGVIIVGGASTKLFISSRRAAVRAARAQKTVPGPIMTPESEAVSEYLRLGEEAEADFKLLERQTVHGDMTLEELKERKAASDRLLENMKQRRDLVEKNSSQFNNASALIRNLDRLIESLKKQSSALDLLIQLKPLVTPKPKATA